MLGFIDTMRAEGHAVESICRVLREQGCQIAARTYRAWRRGLVSAQTVTDALVVDAVRQAAWTIVEIGGTSASQPRVDVGERGRSEVAFTDDDVSDK